MKVYRGFKQMGHFRPEAFLLILHNKRDVEVDENYINSFAEKVLVQLNGLYLTRKLRAIITVELL